MKPLIIFILFGIVIFNGLLFSQDTTKRSIDSLKKPLSFLIEENKYSYLKQFEPDTISRKRFLWFPDKSLDDIFNHLPGFYLRSMDIGQINQLTYNQLDHNNTAVLRNGRPINDIIDGSIDLNLLSRNEISEMELTNGFGSSAYDYLNVVNTIQRQDFLYRPFTELAFWQDRYGNEFLEAYFSQNFIKGFNFNTGIVKQSSDGKYTNSDFDKWLGRFNFNIAPSKSLNFFLYSNYSKIQRGLNEGIKADTIDIKDKETMFNPTLAAVKNSDAYEIKERFDVDAGALFKKGISFSKLQLYVSNSFRKYRDEENRPNPNGITVKDNFHWINYGVKLQEILRLSPARKLKIVSRTEGEYNYIIRKYDSEFLQLMYPADYNTSMATLFENLEVFYGNIYLSGYFRDESYFYDSCICAYLQAGVAGSYTLNLDSLNSLKFSAMYNSVNDYSEAGISFNLGKNAISSKYYLYRLFSYNSQRSEQDNYLIKGISSFAEIRLFNIDLDLTYSFKIESESYVNDFFPIHSGNISLAYHNTGIRDKFEYKIGLISRFWSEYESNDYSGLTNSFIYKESNTVHIPANATLDFYMIGKIGKATFGLTFENILDRLVYSMGVYPQLDRGGLLNVWSRFNITWTFFD